MKKCFPDNMHVGDISFFLHPLRNTVVGWDGNAEQDTHEGQGYHQLHQGEAGRCAFVKWTFH